MQVNVQNRTVMYAPRPAELIPEGVYTAELTEVREFTNAFGARIGLVFEIVAGDYIGMTLMQGAALSSSPHGKLAILLRGIGAGDTTLQTMHALVGKRCRIVVQHGTTKAGKRYAGIVRTIQ